MFNLKHTIICLRQKNCYWPQYLMGKHRRYLSSHNTTWCVLTRNIRMWLNINEDIAPSSFTLLAFLLFFILFFSYYFLIIIFSFLVTFHHIQHKINSLRWKKFDWLYGDSYIHICIYIYDWLLIRKSDPVFCLLAYQSHFPSHSTINENKFLVMKGIDWIWLICVNLESVKEREDKIPFVENFDDAHLFYINVENTISFTRNASQYTYNDLAPNGISFGVKSIGKE